MRLSLLSVRPGTGHDAALDRLVNAYLQRCTPLFAATAHVSRAEATLLEHVRGERRGGALAFWVADLGGRSLTSEDFAGRIGTARDGGVRHLMLAIGPADGWSAEARAAADLRLSLGAMTLPHELARLILAEQVYRASTILRGHPYHLGH